MADARRSSSVAAPPSQMRGDPLVDADGFRTVVYKRRAWGYTPSSPPTPAGPRRPGGEMLQLPGNGPCGLPLHPAVALPPLRASRPCGQELQTSPLPGSSAGAWPPHSTVRACGGRHCSGQHPEPVPLGGLCLYCFVGVGFYGSRLLRPSINLRSLAGGSLAITGSSHMVGFPSGTSFSVSATYH